MSGGYSMTGAASSTGSDVRVPYDVMIYQDATYTYAIKADGTLISSGAIATSNVQFQAAHDYLTLGGLIFVDKGTYTFAAPVAVDHNHINIQGAVPEFANFYFPRVMFQGTAATDFFDIAGSFFGVYGIYFADGLNCLHFSVPVDKNLFNPNVQYCVFEDQTGYSVYLNDTHAATYGFIGEIIIANNLFLHKNGGGVADQPAFVRIESYVYATYITIKDNCFEPGATVHLDFPAGEVLEFAEIANNYSEESTNDHTFIQIECNSPTAYRWGAGIHGNIFNTDSSVAANRGYFCKINTAVGALAGLAIHHNYTNGIIQITNTNTGGGAPDAYIAGVHIHHNHIAFGAIIITGCATWYNMGVAITDNTIIGNATLGQVTCTRTDELTITGNFFGNANVIAIDQFKSVTFTHNKVYWYYATYTVTFTNRSGTAPCYVKDNVGYIGENHGRTSVADAGTIAHGLSGTPTWAVVSGTVATTSDSIFVTAMDATNLTIAIKKLSLAEGAPNIISYVAGTTQYVNWICGVF